MSIIENINEYFRIKGLDALPNAALFLVGSNPLPVYVAAMALKPQKVILLGTKDVEPITNCLKTCLLKELNLNDEDMFTAKCNSADSVDIREKTIKQLSRQPDKNIWLFYTAGTKAMAVHSHEAWKDYVKESHLHWAAYLSSDSPGLWFDTIPIPFPLYLNEQYSVPEPSLDEIFSIHQIKKVNSMTPYKDFYLNDRYIYLSEKIHNYVTNQSNNKRMIKYLELLPPTYVDKISIKFSDHDLKAGGDISFLQNTNFADNSLHTKFSISTWVKSMDIDIDHPIETIDNIGEWLEKDSKPSTSDKRKKWRADALKWLATEWLETWVARSLADSKLFRDVHEGFEYRVQSSSDTKAEIDVCGMRGHTPFIFSCTVDDSSRLGKHKLFEVRLRANQLGGEHARAAVVCLSDTPRRIEEELKQGWPGYGTIKVFGLEDIQSSDIFKLSVNKWINELEREKGVI
jgi:hypothetical protein